MLLLSGFATLIAGLALARSSQQRLDAMLDRLVSRGALSLSGQLGELKDGLKQRAAGWKTTGSLIVAASFLIVFSVTILENWQTPRARSLARLCLFETAWAYVAGGYLGRMVANGRVGVYLKNKGSSVRVFPGHLDGAAGLKPVGDFCFYQARVAAIPCIFLAVWTFLIPLWQDRCLRTRYLQWMHPYMGLLAVALLIEVMAFVVPMRWFHREMRQQKDRALAEADKLSVEIASIRIKLASAQGSDERNELNEQLSFKTKQYWDIERMPTWPVDVPTIKKFTFQSGALMLPLVSEVFGLHETWVKWLQQAFEKAAG
jgi:hypothetical protein